MQIEGLREEVSSVREQLVNEREQLPKEKAKYKLLWRNHCEQSSRDDELIALKEMEVEELQKRLAEFECHSRSVDPVVTPVTVERDPVGPYSQTDTLECDCLHLSHPHLQSSCVGGERLHLALTAGGHLQQFLAEMARDTDQLRQPAGATVGHLLQFLTEMARAMGNINTHPPTLII